MRSLLQDIQEAVGKAASRIALPSVCELSVAHIIEPTIGWLPEDDYLLPLPNSFAENFQHIGLPGQISLALLHVPRIEAFDLGKPTSTCDIAAFELGKAASAFELVEGNWNFADLIAQRSLPLLAELETEELRAALKNSTVPNHIQCLSNTTSISENLNRKLTKARPLRTEDCLALLLARCVVSEDMHKPLAQHARADGKRYESKSQMPDKTPGEDKLQTPELAFAGERHGNRKAFKQASGRVTRGMSAWDLLLPLLQRPVNLDFGTAVELPSNLYPYQTKGVIFIPSKSFCNDYT